MARTKSKVCDVTGVKTSSRNLYEWWFNRYGAP